MNGSYTYIKNKKNVKFAADHLESIIPGYKTYLTEGIIKILNGELVLYKPILANHQYVVLIIVPQSLRRSVFSHFHSGPSGGHMEEYRSPYRMQQRLFCYKIRDDVKKWVKGCSHCVSYNILRTRKQG